MTRSEPHPQRCETCKSFHEERQTPRYRCSWNCCYVHPKDECPCRPSHWEANHSASEPVPEPGGAPNVSCDNDPCQFCFDGGCSFKCRKWDALVQTAATKARAEVLDELRDWSYTIGCNNAAIAAIGLRDRIESLRQQEGKP